MCRLSPSGLVFSILICNQRELERARSTQPTPTFTRAPIIIPNQSAVAHAAASSQHAADENRRRTPANGKLMTKTAVAADRKQQADDEDPCRRSLQLLPPSPATANINCRISSVPTASLVSRPTTNGRATISRSLF